MGIHPRIRNYIGNTFHDHAMNTPRKLSLIRLALSIALLIVFPNPSIAGLKAGVAKVDISPTTFPVIRNGGFLEARDKRVDSPIHSRAIVLEDENARVAIVVVDSCMLPRTLCDQVKADAADRTGIPRNHILIAATHTHSAPSVMNFCLGTRADPNYTKFLPGKILESILVANGSMQPAKIGWAKVNADPFTANRRWVFRKEKMQKDPFGETTVQANMHPGHQHPDSVGTSGPEDPWLSLVSLQTEEGLPLAVLANFSMHYFSGHNGISSDYFGLFAEGLAHRIARENPGFVAAMSQGTSGDLWWGDYSQPTRQSWNMQEYVRKMLDLTEQTLSGIRYEADPGIAMAEMRLRLKRRIPDKTRMAWAKKLNDARGERRPANRPEVYAEQAMFMSENPSEEVVLQALRIGEMGVTAMPNEVYAITGLKIKARSPLPFTFNIELANGAAGYIPPPEQHALGGYTTWPARTAGLDIQAEPTIVNGILALLEKVSGKPKTIYREPIGTYAKAVLEDKPWFYWRLAEFEGKVLQDISGHQNHGNVEGKVAFHLPGPASDSLGSKHVSRAIHLAGGFLQSPAKKLKPPYTLEGWFWNGVRPEDRESTGSLFSKGKESLLLSGTSSPTPGRLQFRNFTGQSDLRRWFWHHVVFVREKESFRVHLNGNKEPDLAGVIPLGDPGLSDAPILFGRADGAASWEGRMDEIAVYDRALSPQDAARHYRIAAVPLPGNKAFAKADTQPISKSSQPDQLDRQREIILSTKPTGYWPLHGESDDQQASDMAGRSGHGTFEGKATPRSSTQSKANFSNGRLRLPALDLKDTYSVSFWFKNQLPHRVRPVTGYLFSRGPDGEASREAPGDHLGIGGTHASTGRLFLFNGNKLYHTRSGRTMLSPGRWNHAVYVRDGEDVRVYLNGQTRPEIQDRLNPTYGTNAAPLFVGSRNDGFAPFEGSLDQVVIFDRALDAEEAALLYTSSGLPLPQPSENSQDEQDLESLPLTAEESMRQTSVPSGFRLELAAMEPIVRDPVALDWGPDGKLWVAEMADYPYGMDGNGKPGGRIRYLLDTDQDGYYEFSQLFLEQVNFPTSVMAWKRGVLVTAAPELFYAEDTDGDGKADIKEVLFEGFIQGNQQLRVNSLRWGLDNWVYAASGGHHAGFGKTTKIKALKTGQDLVLGSRDFRFLPDGSFLDPQSGPAQFGRVRDDWGNWFGVQNSFPLWHYVLEDPYLRRNKDVAAPDTRFQIRVPPNPKVYQNKPAQKRFHSFEQAGRFTSACGPGIYRDKVLFPQTKGLTHAFTCEPFHNLVQHHLVRPEGPTFRGERAISDGPKDFFASADRWSRPVMARTGPDGALYVVDMYRYMIEHPDWLPKEGREELKPHYRSGENYGRIYRTVSSSGDRHRIPIIRGKSFGQLVELLGNPNGIVRDLVHQELLSHAEPQSESGLEKMASSHTDPRVRLQTLAVLDGLGQLKASSVQKALQDENGWVRRKAVRLAEGLAATNPELIPATLALEKDSHPSVLLQLACTLGEWKDPRAGEVLITIAKLHPKDRYFNAAVLSSAPGHYEALSNQLLSQSEVAKGLMAMGARDEVRRQALLRKIRVDQTSPPSPTTLQRAALFLTVLKEQNQSWKTLDATSKSELSKLFEEARQWINSPTTPQAVRLTSLKLLGFEDDQFDRDLKQLTNLLGPKNPPVFQKAALQTLASWNHPKATLALLDSWDTYAPATRQELTGFLLRNKANTRILIRQLEENQVAATDLNPAHRQQLLKHPDPSIAKKASTLLQSSNNEDLQKTIRELRTALTLKGVISPGKQLFEERCASCHQLGGTGNDVGPDLRTLTDKSGVALLSAIVDPNQNVDPRYLGYTITMANDETVYGIISSETGNSIIMKTLDGSTRQVLRQDIRGVSSSRLSLMPEGLEAGLSPQAMANLITFIQQASQ